MIWIWLGFIVFILILLALDLGVFHRQAHAVKMREALGWSAVWVALGLLFAVFVYYGYEHQWMGLGTVADAVDGQINDGRSATIKYLTGYVVEKSLSIDNIFVIAALFSFLAVPAIYQHRVLFWGVLSALVMRGLMIALGSRLVADFHWILYVFGVLLIFTAIKLLFAKTDHQSHGPNRMIGLARRFLPLTDAYHGQHFFIREQGSRKLTPLALSLVMVEATDLIFAVDSIPAIFALTADPFLVFTSNVFAMLGLRSLYFALAGLLTKFRYLKVSLAAVLAVVGGKMLTVNWLKEYFGPNLGLYLLGVILLILATGVIASILADRAAPKKEMLRSNPC